MENVNNDGEIGRSFDRMNARYFDEAGNRVSGLDLWEIGLDAHGVANTLWRISSYLQSRAAGIKPQPRPKNTSRRIDRVHVEGETL